MTIPEAAIVGAQVGAQVVMSIPSHILMLQLRLQLPSHGLSARIQTTVEKILPTSDGTFMTMATGITVKAMAPAPVEALALAAEPALVETTMDNTHMELYATSKALLMAMTPSAHLTTIGMQWHNGLLVTSMESPTDGSTEETTS